MDQGDMTGMTGMDSGDMTNMAGMDHSKMAGMDKGDMSNMAGMDHSKMAGMGSGDMSGMAGMGGMGGEMQTHPASETNNPLVDMQAMNPTPKLNDPGIGLRNNGRRVLTYSD
jgi:uncharacterized protein involved in copper resistance